MGDWMLSTLLTRCLVAAVNFLILLVSSRYLGPTSRGEISLFLLNIMLVQLCNEVVTGYGLIRFADTFDFRKVLAYGLLFSACCVPLVYFTLMHFGKQVNGFEAYGFWLTLLVVLNTFFCVVTLARGAIRTYNLLCVLQPSLLLIGILLQVFAWRIFTFEAYAHPLFWSFALSGLFSAWLAFGVLRGNKGGEFSFSRIFVTGALYQGGILLFTLSNRLSFYLIPSTSDLGVYAAASSIVDALIMLAGGLSPVLIRKVAERPDPASSAIPTMALARISLLLTVICVLFMAILPISFYTGLLGQGFHDIKYTMLMYCPGALCLSFALPFSAYFSGMGNQVTVFLGYAGGFLMTFILSPLLTPTLGLKGAALAANASYLVMSTIFIYSFYRHTGYGPANRWGAGTST